MRENSGGNTIERNKSGVCWMKKLGCNYKLVFCGDLYGDGEIFVECRVCGNGSGEY